METLPTFPATVDELIARFLHACGLKQAVDWPRIVECMQEWSSVMNLTAPAILRIETSGEYLKALQIAGDAKQWAQQRQTGMVPDSWAKRAIRELESAKNAKATMGIIRTSPAVGFARGVAFKNGGKWNTGAASLTSTPPMATYARQDTQWLSIVTIGAVESGNIVEFRKWYPLFKAFEAGALCFLLTEGGIEVCPLPSVVRADGENRLHSVSGPAFVWLNDVEGYYWHGVQVETYVVDHPERITVADIEAEPDAEVRQVKIERFIAAHPNQEMPLVRTVTADELKDRYFRACELNRRVDWERIVTCIRRWAAAFDIPVPRLIQVENSEQLKKTANVTWAYKISPRGLSMDVMARSQGSTHNTWGQEAWMAESGARTYRHAFAHGGGVNDIARAERLEQLAVEKYKKSTTSAAGAATEVRSKKIAPAMVGAVNVWGANVTTDGRTTWNGPAAWDITLKCICAIDALEQPHQGTKFFNWYQLFKAFEAGACCFFFNEQGIEVCTLPSIVRVDDEGRLHSAVGPAFAWLDDVRDYYWHGIRVEAYVAEDPGRITVVDIESETNVEVRRVKIERFGPERYLIQSGARMVHQDDYGMLFRKELPGDEPLVMVKVVNATPESDGSFKDYFLRVPPTVQTAREAVAWTFGKAPCDYRPVKES
ncbi:MAG: DUF6745 domain-containing protein [Limisphaerales bacterium]